jgi:hypothetical protein
MQIGFFALLFPFDVTDETLVVLAFPKAFQKTRVGVDGGFFGFFEDAFDHSEGCVVDSQLC